MLCSEAALSDAGKKIAHSSAAHHVSSSEFIFSTSHFIPHIRALVPCPGLTSEACVVASTSVPLTPTEILNLVFL